jgi:uncharacterized damage-inducible protein DinB
MATIHELVEELDREAPVTRRTLEQVREDKLDWKPHERSQSLGQLAYHVANIPRALGEMSLLTDFDVSFVVPRPSIPNRADLLKVHDESVARAREVLNGMKDADLSLPWRMMHGTTEIAAMPRGVFLRSILFNHWYHHRGQLTVYLRETGSKVPAIYGASADEVPGR